MTKPLQRGILLGLAVVGVGFASSAQAQIQKQQTLRIAAGSWCPYICLPGDSPLKQQGAMVEIVTAIYEPLGYKIELKPLGYASSLKAAKAGAVDAVMGSSPVESQYLLFPKEPLGYGIDIFVSRPESTWMYRGPQSMAGQIMVAIAGYHYGELQPYVSANRSRPTLAEITGGANSLESTYEMLRLLDTGKATVGLDNVHVLEFLQKTRSELPAWRYAGPAPYDEYYMYLGINARHPKAQVLANDFDQGMAELRTSKKLARILGKYGLIDWEKVRENDTPDKSPSALP